MNKTRLYFKGITEIVGVETMGLVVLTDAEEKRQITIVCDQQTEIQFGLRMGRIPVVNKMLPEVLVKVIREQSDINLEILFDSIQNDQYHALLCNINTMSQIPIRASDAALLSYVGGIPIYMNDILMNMQSVPYTTLSSGMAIPVNVVSDDMLKSALDKAVREENYELASRLRDEQIRRNKQIP